MGFRAVLREQAGVIARRQLRASGLQPHEIRRMLARRELTVVLPGVYVDHSGEPSWLQHAWAAVLACWPAALSHDSALRAAEGAGRSRRRLHPLHVAVGESRRLRAPDGVVLHRMPDFDERVQWNHGPPRIRYEDAALDVALAADSEMEALGALAAACQSRRTTARGLIGFVGRRARIPQRNWLDAVLRDVADGTCSVLEHGYVSRVERPHGLPRAQRRPRATASCGLVYRDAAYGGRVLLELDGRLFHDSANQRDRDLEHRLDAAVDGRASARLAWGQVFDRPCTTAAKVARLLARRGIAVRPRPCGPGCPVSDAVSGALATPGDTDPPDYAA